MRPRHAVVSILASSLVLGTAQDLSARGAPTVAPEAAAIHARVEPAVFSPNGDGRMDSTTITVESDTATTVEIEVVEGSRVRRSWTAPASPGAPATVTWDGRAEGGAELADGVYVIRARATPTEALGEDQTSVALDTAAPSFRWLGSRPKLVSKQKRLRFRFRASDPAAPLQVRADVEDDAGPVGHHEEKAGSGTSTMRWRSGRLYPGNYRVRLRVTDAVGNATAAGPFRFRVQRSMGGRVWRRVPAAGRSVALTIDDCHYEGAWASMLRTLDERGAGATFFCPGQMIRAHPGLVRRTIHGGYAIGSHGWDHAALTTQSRAGVERRLRQDASALWRVARQTTAPYFRPPYGAFNRGVVAAAGRTSHPRVIMWDVDTGDWASPGVGTIVSRAVKRAKPGSIILLHTKPQTAAALPGIISGLRDRGLEPVGLPELFR